MLPKISLVVPQDHCGDGGYDDNCYDHEVVPLGRLALPRPSGQQILSLPCLLVPITVALWSYLVVFNFDHGCVNVPDWQDDVV